MDINEAGIPMERTMSFNRRQYEENVRMYPAPEGGVDNKAINAENQKLRRKGLPEVKHYGNLHEPRATHKSCGFTVLHKYIHTLEQGRLVLL